MTTDSIQTDVRSMPPHEFRSLVRSGVWRGANREACPDFAHATLVALPEEFALEFLLFCDRNPQPCPLLEMTQPGAVAPARLAPQADLRTDLPRYRVFESGTAVADPFDVRGYWRDDLVCFLLGCSRGVDAALVRAELAYRLIGIYDTDIALAPAGRFEGRMAVSCRAFPTGQEAVLGIQASRQQAFHGAPVHVGDPASIGISDFAHPDYPLPYPAQPPREDETLVYWGCGVTPQNVALECKVPFMIASYEGHLFVTDRPVHQFA